MQTFIFALCFADCFHYFIEMMEYGKMTLPIQERRSARLVNLEHLEYRRKSLDFPRSANLWPQSEAHRKSYWRFLTVQ